MGKVPTRTTPHDTFQILLSRFLGNAAWMPYMAVGGEPVAAEFKALQVPAPE